MPQANIVMTKSRTWFEFDIVLGAQRSYSVISQLQIVGYGLKTSMDVKKSILIIEDAKERLRDIIKHMKEREICSVNYVNNSGRY